MINRRVRCCYYFELAGLFRLELELGPCWQQANLGGFLIGQLPSEPPAPAQFN